MLSYSGVLSLINELRKYETVTDVERAPLQAGIKLAEAASMLEEMLSEIRIVEALEGIEILS